MKWRYIITLPSILIATIVLITPLGHVYSLSGSDFKASRIIDDLVFTNKNTMTPMDIQYFLNSKLPSCDRTHPSNDPNHQPPYTCLNEYQENTSTGESNYGRFDAGWIPVQISGSKSAAQIIWDASQKYNINPQALIVLLQKEQSLITDNWPWLIQYQKATGYKCPTNAPCDPSKAGFYRQVDGAAWQFRHDLDGIDTPGYWSSFGKGWNNIPYSPDGNCGTKRVYIENQATAVLYKYTPYTPNDAALASMSDNSAGGEVTCGAYGNRNFFWYFTKWFGSTQTSIAYYWSYAGQKAYSDIGMINELDETPTVQPGQKVYLSLKATNYGYRPWAQSFLKLGTSNPIDRKSVFKDISWLSESRVASINETEVPPSYNATFNFAVTAPNTEGSYKEYFNVVADGITWLNNLGLYYKINVVRPTAPRNTLNTILKPNGQITNSSYLLSPDTYSTLIVQGDGNVVLYSNFKPVWQTATSNGIGNRLVMQNDGNLVLYNNKSSAIWSSQTYGHPSSKLVLQVDGNLVIYDSENKPLWSTDSLHNPNFLEYTNDKLTTAHVFPGQLIETANRDYWAILQPDGNFVLYSKIRPLWSTNTYNKKVAFAKMQNDGNFVLYDNSGKAVWQTSTVGSGLSSLIVQPDGNFVLYDNSGKAVWQTSTVIYQLAQ